jgi:hypothetical protein
LTEFARHESHIGIDMMENIFIFAGLRDGLASALQTVAGRSLALNFKTHPAVGKKLAARVTTSGPPWSFRHLSAKPVFVNCSSFSIRRMIGQ